MRSSSISMKRDKMLILIFWFLTPCACVLSERGANLALVDPLGFKPVTNPPRYYIEVVWKNKATYYINWVVRSSDHQDNGIVNIEDNSSHTHPVLFVVVEFKGNSKE